VNRLYFQQALVFLKLKYCYFSGLAAIAQVLTLTVVGSSALRKEDLQRFELIVTAY